MREMKAAKCKRSNFRAPNGNKRNELEKEKGIKKEYVLESIETALVTAYKRNFDVNTDNVKITMNSETGEIHVYEELTVVEEVEDDKIQISLEEAMLVS